MKSQTPLVSIVTPSLNQGRFLEQTILSVLDQSYRNIEYLIIDGGSTDQSVEIIKKYASRIAYWQSGSDSGFGDAIAQGFHRSKGDVLAYLNSDDLLAPDAVEQAMETLNQLHDVVMVYGNRVCIDEDGQVLYYRPNLAVLSRTPYIAMTLAQESCFWRREIYFRVGGVNTHLKFAIDYDLFSKIARRGKIVHAGSVWGFFRKHALSKTMTEFQSVGKREGTAIQEQVWGRRVNPIMWVTVSLIVRFYALFHIFFLPKPQWPSCLPRKSRRGLLRRLFHSLHESGAGKRAIRGAISWFSRR